MASIKKSISRLYMGKNVVPFHVFFLFSSAIMVCTFFSMGFLNIVPLLIFLIAGAIMSGFYLQIANTRLNNIYELPELDESIVMVILKFVPVGAFISLLMLPASIIPVLGIILQLILNLTVAPVVTMAFCKNFEIKEAIDWQKIKTLSPKIIGPAFFLMLKLFLLSIVEFIIFGGVLSIVAKDNPFVIVTTIFYIMLVNNLIYSDSMAQVYNEVNVVEN